MGGVDSDIWPLFPLVFPLFETNLVSFFEILGYLVREGLLQTGSHFWEIQRPHGREAALYEKLGQDLVLSGPILAEGLLGLIFYVPHFLAASPDPFS